MSAEKLLTRDEARAQFAKFGLNALEAHKMMGFFGLKQVSDPKVLRRFEPGSIDETQPNAETLRSISAFLAMLAAAHSAAPEPREIEEDFEPGKLPGVVRSPLPVPVLGVTRGGNVVRPSDLYFERREVYVPMFASQHRWMGGDVPLRAVIFTTSMAAVKDAKPNNLLNGWAALFSLDYAIAFDDLFYGTGVAFWSIVKFATHCPKMVARGAEPDPEDFPTVVAQIRVKLAGDTIDLLDGDERVFASLGRDDVDTIWPVMNFLPKNHF